VRMKSAKFKTKKERESTNAKSFPQERESASAKPKKKTRAQLCGFLPSNVHTFWSLGYDSEKYLVLNCAQQKNVGPAGPFNLPV
jgi:hypothetical protein